MKEANVCSKKKETHRCREQNSGHRWGKEMVERLDNGMGLRDIYYYV